MAREEKHIRDNLLHREQFAFKIRRGICPGIHLGLFLEWSWMIVIEGTLNKATPI